MGAADPAKMHAALCVCMESGCGDRDPPRRSSHAPPTESCNRARVLIWRGGTVTWAIFLREVGLGLSARVSAQPPPRDIM